MGGRAVFSGRVALPALVEPREVSVLRERAQARLQSGPPVRSPAAAGPPAPLREQQAADPMRLGSIREAPPASYHKQALPAPDALPAAAS